MSLLLCEDGNLTIAHDPISTVSLVTGTGEAVRGVDTGSIRGTVISTSSTLISNICERFCAWSIATTRTVLCFTMHVVAVKNTVEPPYGHCPQMMSIYIILTDV